MVGTTEKAGKSSTREASRRRGPFADGVLVGLLVVIAGTLGVMAAMGELLPEALVFLIVFVGLGVWTTRNQSSWLRWVIAGLLLVFVGINLAFAIPDLSHPESPSAFIATAVVVFGGLATALLAALAATRHPAPGRWVWTAGAGVLALVAVGSLAAAANVEDDVAQPGDVEIVASNSEFPEMVDADAAATGVFVRNADRFRHTLVIEGETSAVEIPANSQVRVETDLAPGSYHFYCDIIGHEDMEGTLVVG